MSHNEMFHDELINSVKQSSNDMLSNNVCLSSTIIEGLSSRANRLSVQVNKFLSDRVRSADRDT